MSARRSPNLSVGTESCAGEGARQLPEAGEETTARGVSREPPPPAEQDTRGIRWSSWGSMAEGGKRYKDLKAAQSILRQSTAMASGWGKADTQRGRRWLIGDAIRSTSSGPAQRRIAPNDN